MIKKRCFWPAKGFSLSMIYLSDLQIIYPGTFEIIKFDVFAMEEPADYVMMRMSTYGALIEHWDQKLSYRGSIASTGDATSFKYYKEVFANHYIYQGVCNIMFSRNRHFYSMVID